MISLGSLGSGFRKFLPHLPPSASTSCLLSFTDMSLNTEIRFSQRSCEKLLGISSLNDERSRLVGIGCDFPIFVDSLSCPLRIWVEKRWSCDFRLVSSAGLAGLSLWDRPGMIDERRNSGEPVPGLGHRLILSPR